jgi:MFS family permease
MAVLSLVLFGLGADLLDGASRIWATIYLRDAFDVSALVESMALPALVLTMAAGRLVADPWIDRLGPARVGRAALTVALIGLLVLVAATEAWMAILGFALAGLGVSVIYPLMISGAARLGDRPAAENVAATTLLFQLIMLLAPVLIGAGAEALGLRATYGLLLPLLVLGWIMAGRLR